VRYQNQSWHNAYTVIYLPCQLRIDACDLLFGSYINVCVPTAQKRERKQGDTLYRIVRFIGSLPLRLILAQMRIEVNGEAARCHDNTTSAAKRLSYRVWPPFNHGTRQGDEKSRSLQRGFVLRWLRRWWRTGNKVMIMTESVNGILKRQLALAGA